MILCVHQLELANTDAQIAKLGDVSKQRDDLEVNRVHFIIY